MRQPRADGSVPLWSGFGSASRPGALEAAAGTTAEAAEGAAGALTARAVPPEAVMVMKADTALGGAVLRSPSGATTMFVNRKAVTTAMIQAGT